jgi:hypothetical protein
MSLYFFNKLIEAFSVVSYSSVTLILAVIFQWTIKDPNVLFSWRLLYACWIPRIKPNHYPDYRVQTSSYLGDSRWWLHPSRLLLLYTRLGCHVLCLLVTLYWSC